MHFLTDISENDLLNATEDNKPTLPQNSAVVIKDAGLADVSAGAGRDGEEKKEEPEVKEDPTESVSADDLMTDEELAAANIYSNEYASQSQNYGSKNSYDEFHTAPKDIPANDGYKSGGFDELHINENYKQNVWHPEHRGYRISGFDEFRYPDEM